MKLNKRQRDLVKRGIFVALNDHKETNDAEKRTEILRRVSRMIANLNGRSWLE